ncbi:WD repeats-containing protein [Cryptosporidium ubiquitum]|uniref:Cleavage stimulation factor 50 kDa subunit n=1 Tax=Cryptosporidium ubiquitum TaxID=857276 RepID=A0A1J4ME68_9CRYT|nr:WD repeats-containing protein [Cryptosporidium ubiquitum]OII72287.1 WD repeats-containing protein [Cryptosporidium ubiquitum]
MNKNDNIQMVPMSDNAEDHVNVKPLNGDESSAANNINTSIYGENKLNITKTNELGSSIIKEYLEFEPLKISLYELIMRQLMDDGLTEVAQLLHIKTKTCIPIHLNKNSLYNLYKTVTYLPMDLRQGNHENNENNDLLELKSTNYVKRIESVLPHLENLTKQWVPIRPKSRFLYYYKKKGNYSNGIMKSYRFDITENIQNSNNHSEDIKNEKEKSQIIKDVSMKEENQNEKTSEKNNKEFYFLENLSKIKLQDSWNAIPNISVNFRGNSVLSNHRPYCRALAVNPNGGYIATGGADGIVKIVPAPSQGVNGTFNSSIFGIGTNSSISSQQKTFTESKGIITSLEYRIRKDILISGDTDSTLIIYDVKGITGGNSGDLDEITPNITNSGNNNQSRILKKPIQSIRESSPINCIQMHPLDDHFFVGTQDPILRLYDIHTNDSFTSSHPIHQHCSSINGIKISQDGSIVCTCSEDGTIKFWDSVNLSCINTIYGAHNGFPVHSLSFSLSQRYLVSSGGDGIARLWDLRMGRELVKYSSGLRSSCHSKVSLLVDERYTILSAVDSAGSSYSKIISNISSPIDENKSGVDQSSNIIKDHSIMVQNREEFDPLSINIGLRINNKSNLFSSKICNQLKSKNYTILDHQIKQNPIGDLLIFNTLSGNLVGTVEGIHDAPIMNFELLYNNNLNSNMSNNVSSNSIHNNLPCSISDCSLVTVSDDGKCRILDLNYSSIL